MSGGLPPEPQIFRPLDLLEVLTQHGVQFVVIGGVAANLHGSNQLTQDLDLAYEVSEDNKARLVSALNELGAVRVTDPERAGPVTVEGLEHRVESFTTPIGDVDVFQFARNIGGFVDIRDRAEVVELRGGTVFVADIDSIIWSKAGSGRDKDPAHIRSLERVKEERANRRIEGTEA